MKKTVAALTTAILVSLSSTAHAECFGEAAEAYGCGISAPREGTLQEFGSSSKPVVPYYGPQSNNPFDGLFSRQEQRHMLRGIVLSNLARARFANQAFNRAVNSNAQPIRRQGNEPVTISFGGVGW